MQQTQNAYPAPEGTPKQQPTLVALASRIEGVLFSYHKSADSLEELRDRLFGSAPQGIEGEKDHSHAGTLSDLERLIGYLDAVALRFEGVANRLGQIS